LKVLAPSAQRIDPPCAHVAECGGCDLMHLPAEARRELHRRHVRELLSRAGCENTEVGSIAMHEAPAQLGYRTRARFFVRGQRVGYRAARSHRLAAVEHCVVLRPELDPVIEELAGWLAGAKGEGEALVALGAGNRPVVELRWNGSLDASIFAGADARVREGTWAGVRIWMEGATKPAAFGHPSAVVTAADGAPLLLEGFGQASEWGGNALATRVAEIVRACAPRTIVELYAGSGTLSVALAPLAERFTAVEAAPEAARCLRENLAARGSSAKIVVDDAAKTSHRADVVVLDPPRSGAAEVMSSLVTTRPKHVVYVSCDASTLARDAAVLCRAGYGLYSIDVFELFPQTSHFETVAHFERR